VCVGQRLQECVRDVEVHDGNAVLGAAAVDLVELVEKLLADRVGFVVLVDSRPAQHCLPQQFVEPRVLERGDDPDPGTFAGGADVGDVCVPDVRALDEHSHCFVAGVRQLLGPEHGSSPIDPIGNDKVHGPNHASEPVRLNAGTSKRRSLSTFVGSQLSVMNGPKIARQPSSTRSP
jgi:hypothetical protein